MARGEEKVEADGQLPERPALEPPNWKQLRTMMEPEYLGTTCPPRKVQIVKTNPRRGKGAGMAGDRGTCWEREEER